MRIGEYFVKIHTCVCAPRSPLRGPKKKKEKDEPGNNKVWINNVFSKGFGFKYPKKKTIMIYKEYEEI